jgi:predicted acetyltransferase
MKQIKNFVFNLIDRQEVESSLFQFRDPGLLVDDDLELMLVSKHNGDPRQIHVPVYIFNMILIGRPQIVMGRLSLRIGHTEHIEMYAGHIGYTVEPAHRGHHYAARSCRLVLPLAKDHEIDPLWITCNPDNIASRRTCEILGATLMEIVPIPADDPLYQADTKWKCRYSLRGDQLKT